MQQPPSSDGPEAEIAAWLDRDGNGGVVVAGRYELARELGRGTYGAVFGAYDRELERAVAIKVFCDATPEPMARREAVTLARLSHPNVVAVHDIGRLGPLMFMVMDMAFGTNMAERIRGWSGWRDPVSLFIQAGRGLAAAHRRGIAHGDVKPGNLLVGDDGRVQVADFGLAQRLLVEPAEAGTGPGTREYAAPERLAGVPADAASDQFSFCVSLWQAVYGCRPWPSNDAETVGSVEPVMSWPKIVAPRQLERVLRRGLALEPRRRFDSMDALVDALTRVLTLVERRRIRRWAIALGITVALSTTALLRLLGH